MAFFDRTNVNWRSLAVCAATVVLAQPALAQVVRPVYLVPADREVREEYRQGIELAVRDMQAFYQAQLGNGQTFTMHSDGVRVLRSPQLAAWFAQNEVAGVGLFSRLFVNVQREVERLMGVTIGRSNDVWALYVDADPVCGQCGGCGGGRVSVIAANDLRGLAGEAYRTICPNDPPDRATLCRWIGGLGHELGHAFGLPHPPGCDAGQPTCDHNALLWNGFRNYRETYLRSDERTQLLTTPWITAQPPLAPLAVCGRVAPESPTLRATADGAMVTFSWRPSLGGGAPQSYRLDVGPVPGASSLARLTIPGPTAEFRANAVAPGVYYARLVAINPWGLSQPSNEVLLTVGCAAPPAPATLSVVVQGTSVTAHWSPSSASGVTYLLEAGSAPGRSDLAQLTVPGTTFSAVASPGRYYVRVRARSACADSIASNEVEVIIAPSRAPDAPGNLRAHVQGTFVQLTWDAPIGDVAGYSLEAGGAPGASDIAILPLAAATTVFSTGNVPAGSYFVRVRAHNTAGASPASNEVSIVVR